MEILALNFPCLQIAIGQHGKFKKPIFKPDPKLKLMDQVRQVLRYHHYTYRTEQTYCDWIVRFIKFQNAKINPAHQGWSEIETCLSSDITRRHLVMESGPQKVVKLRWIKPE